MATVDMVAEKPIFFEYLNYILVRPVEGPSRHIRGLGLHAHYAKVLYLNR